MRRRAASVLRACTPILEDGRLNVPDSVLRRADSSWRAWGIRSTYQDRQTERLLRAMDNRYFSILGAPTARLIEERRPASIDLARVLQKARERGCVVELDSRPARLDLDDTGCRAAKAAGVSVCISSCAHDAAGFDALAGGVVQARRGWLEAPDVLNTARSTECRPAGADHGALNRSEKSGSGSDAASAGAGLVNQHAGEIPRVIQTTPIAGAGLCNRCLRPEVRSCGLPASGGIFMSIPCLAPIGSPPSREALPAAVRRSHRLPATDKARLRDMLACLGIDDDELDGIDPRIPVAVWQVFQGSPLLLEATASTLYVVRSGTCKAARVLEDGYEQVLSFALPGELLGSVALHGGRQAATVTALEDSTVYALPVCDLRELRRLCSVLDAALQRALSCQLVRAAQTTAMNAAVSSDVRLARFLLDVATHGRDGRSRAACCCAWDAATSPACCAWRTRR
jgi:CRP-like cAMP-binding protein